MDDLAAVEAAIYDQSFRALDEQARVLDALRARAGALVASASVATALLGSGRNFDANARQLRALDATFVIASVCLGCELIVWLWILAS